MGLVAVAAVCAQTPQRDVLVAEAAALIQRGSWEEAVGILHGVVRESPEDADALLLLGSALSMVPRRAAAADALLRAIELRPDHAPSHATAGAAFARLGEREAATRVFERALALDPSLGDAHLNLALILAGDDEFERAAEHMAKALELEGDPARLARLHFLNGKLFAERDRIADAVREFERSLALDQRNGETHLALGLALKSLLREDDAYPLFLKAAELAPTSWEARYQLGLELQRRREIAAAADRFLEAYALRPGDQSIVYNLARALHQAGRREESARYRAELKRMTAAADKARENELGTARLHAEAVSLEGSGNYVAALVKYREVLEFEPLNALARRNLALVLCRLGRWEEGIAELRAILRDDPDDAESARALVIALDRAREAQVRPIDGVDAKSAAPGGVLIGPGR